MRHPESAQDLAVTRAPRRAPRRRRDDARDGWSPNLVTRWLAGVVLPAPFVLLGARYLALRIGPFRGWYSAVTVTGTEAIALGGAITSVGLFLHARFFWGECRRLARYSGFAQAVTAAAFVGCMGMLAIGLTRS